MNTSEVKDIGKIIRLNRKQSGLSQSELANLSGVGRSVVYEIEKGKLNIRLNTLLKVLKALNIKIEVTSPIKADSTTEGI